MYDTTSIIHHFTVIRYDSIFFQFCCYYLLSKFSTECLSRICVKRKITRQSTQTNISRQPSKANRSEDFRRIHWNFGFSELGSHHKMRKQSAIIIVVHIVRLLRLSPIDHLSWYIRISMIMRHHSLKSRTSHRIYVRDVPLCTPFTHPRSPRVS